MKLKEIEETLEAEVLTGVYDQDYEIEKGCASDLMSDILAFAKPGAILLTSLVNLQVINTANMTDIKVVCFVMDKTPAEIMINHAIKNDIVIFKTKLTSFESCGLLFEKGIKSCSYTTFDSLKTYII